MLEILRGFEVTKYPPVIAFIRDDRQSGRDYRVAAIQIR
jgi:hypothetical protein